MGSQGLFEASQLWASAWLTMHLKNEMCRVVSVSMQLTTNTIMRFGCIVAKIVTSYQWQRSCM